MTGVHYRETAIAPAYDLVLAVRRRRLRYLGHVLRMPAERMVGRALMALVSDTIKYPTCGNGVESYNVARQSGVVVVLLRF